MNWSPPTPCCPSCKKSGISVRADWWCCTCGSLWQAQSISLPALADREEWIFIKCHKGDAELIPSWSTFDNYTFSPYSLSIKYSLYALGFTVIWDNSIMVRERDWVGFRTVDVAWKTVVQRGWTTKDNINWTRVLADEEFIRDMLKKKKQPEKEKRQRLEEPGIHIPHIGDTYHNLIALNGCSVVPEEPGDENLPDAPDPQPEFCPECKQSYFGHWVKYRSEESEQWLCLPCFTEKVLQECDKRQSLCTKGISCLSRLKDGLHVPSW